MLIDFASGLLVYVVVSWLFHEPLQMIWTSFAVFCSILPDLDIPPYLVWRKRMGWVSHHLIHFPLVFMAIGLGICWFSGYAGALFLGGALAHFLHDTATTPHGIRWLWPFSQAGFTFYYGKIEKLEPLQRKLFFSKVRNEIKVRHGAKGRRIIDEITSRLEKLTVAKRAYLLVAALALSLFWYLQH